MAVLDRSILPVPSRMYSLEILNAVASLQNGSAVTFTALGDTLFISKPALINTLRDLIRQGLVRKDETDRFYVVTAEGVQFLEKIRKENTYVDEILRLMLRKLEARNSIASMVASIEQKVIADPELRKAIPSDKQQQLREYIALKIEKLLEEISQGYFLQQAASSASGTGGAPTC
jgi:DNA-binding PadR family transcriptional regulator